MSSERAVGPVIGVILIIAIVLTVAVTVAAFGAAMLQDTQSSIEHSQTETAFSQLAVDASELRENGSRVDFELGHQDGQVRTVDDTGNLVVELQKGGNTTPLRNTSLNSLVYERDGKQVAYQGGGVFRKQGDGSSLVSAPEFFYRDNSLVFPVTVLKGDVQKSGSLDGSLKLTETKRLYPTESAERTNPLDAGTLYIRVQSEYCQGWEEYFESQTRGAVAEECSANTDGEVKVELSVPFELSGDSISSGVHYTGKCSKKGGGGPGNGGGGGGSSCPFSDVESGSATDWQSPDMLINSKEEACEDWGIDSTVTETGLHCVNEITGNTEFDTDAAGGDIEVYVDEDIHIDKDILVNGEHNVTFYVNGDVDMSGGRATFGSDGASQDPSQTRVFVSSDGLVGSGGGGNPADIYAMIYAPESDAHIQAGGGHNFEGALVTKNITGQGSPEVDHSASIESIEIKENGAGPEFYYLHLVEKTMTIQA